MKNNWVDYRNTNGIFKTGLLSFQHLLLDWYETAQYNILLKQGVLKNQSQFSSFFIIISYDI